MVSYKRQSCLNWPFSSYTASTRSQNVVMAYHRVVLSHRSYRPSCELPRGEPRTHHMWNCLQLSNTRGVDNGGFRPTHLHNNTYAIHVTVTVLPIPLVILQVLLVLLFLILLLLLQIVLLQLLTILYLHLLLIILLLVVFVVIEVAISTFCHYTSVAASPRKLLV